MGLEKPGRLPKAICFRAVLYCGSFYDGAGQLGFDRADHGYRIYAGKRGAGTTPELWHRLVVLVSILIGFTMFRMCFNYLSVMTYETCSQKLLFKLRRDLYANMQAQDSSFFSKNRTGDLMTRLTGDLDMVRHTTCYVIRMIIDCVVLFLTTSITFLCVDWLFALAMLAVTPIIFILTKVFAKQVHPLYVDCASAFAHEHCRAGEHRRQPCR